MSEMAWKQPPEGWSTFGTHAGDDPCPRLEFSSEVGTEDGLPLWERPVCGALFYGHVPRGVLHADFSVPRTCNLPPDHDGSHRMREVDV